eukprot:TRINITY_DN10457_c0_g2_i1.p1 TRINITY_DN10457_c0_g2~~TRINITY_DN10457_c0_g2_i1.p1  ORF type:complete len:227 (+),score=37.40 TRINITY_DN10457_c0_g2_i1:112-792(+)
MKLPRAAAAVTIALLVNILADEVPGNKVPPGHGYDTSADRSCALLQGSVRPTSAPATKKRRMHGYQESSELSHARSLPATAAFEQTSIAGGHASPVLDAGSSRATLGIGKVSSALTSHRNTSSEGGLNHGGGGGRSSSAMAKLQWTAAAAELQEATWPYYAIATMIVVVLTIFLCTCSYSIVLLVYTIFKTLYQVVDFATTSIGIDVLPDLEEDKDEQQSRHFGCC